MRIVVAGGHGQIAMLLHPLLMARGHQVIGLIRNPDHADAVRSVGAEPLICDLESDDDVVPAIAQNEAIIFAAGAGPGSGAARKLTMDRDGALKLIDAAQKCGITRFVVISAMNAEIPRGDHVFRTYLKAKSAADAALRASGLDYTIVRPGRLTNDPGTGKVSIAGSLHRAEIARADVAQVVSETVEAPKAFGVQFDVTSGGIPITEAIRRAFSADGDVIRH